MGTIKKLMDGRWSLTDEDFEKLLSADVPSQGQDHLVAFRHVADRYDASDDLLIAWLPDTGESPPSFPGVIWRRRSTQPADLGVYVSDSVRDEPLAVSA